MNFCYLCVNFIKFSLFFSLRSLRLITFELCTQFIVIQAQKEVQNNWYTLNGTSFSKQIARRVSVIPDGNDKR